MCIKVITLPFDERTKSIDDDKLVRFMVGKEMISKSDYIIEEKGNIYLIVVIRYINRQNKNDGPVDFSSPEKNENKNRINTKQVKTASKSPSFSNKNGDNPKASLKSKTSYQPKSLDLLQMQIYERMRKWRYAEATKNILPAYMICSNLQLEKIVELRPKNIEELETIEGMKGEKIKTYGTPILNALRNTLKTMNTEKEYMALNR